MSRETCAGRSVAFLFITEAEARSPLIQEYMALAAGAARAGVQLLLVSVNSLATTRAFAAELQPTVPLLVVPPPNNPFMHDYKIHTLPRYYLINGAGTVQATGYPSRQWGQWTELVETWA